MTPEEIQKLAAKLSGSLGGDRAVDEWEQVIREALASIGGPTHLGAVVRDARGHLWVRANLLRYAWVDSTIADDNLRLWGAIPAPVEVLSQGWAQP